MKLFQSTCIFVRHSGGITSYPISEYDEVREGVFKSRNNGTEVNLYDSLKIAVAFSTEKVLEVFSNWVGFQKVELTVGNIVRVEFSIPNAYLIFAADIPTAVMGNMEKGEHFFPYLFGVDNNIVLIGTTTHQVTNNPIGRQMSLFIGAYAYDSAEAPGWKRIFYYGLSDFSRKRWDTSVFILATAIELYADYIFSKYLEKKSIPEKIRDKVVSQTTNWRPKMERIRSLASEVLSDFNNSQFEEMIKFFGDKVRKPRNAFAHKDLKEEISMQHAHEAYIAAFDILWMLDRLDATLNT